MVVENCCWLLFQHTAARRRLAAAQPKHKAEKCFNTQPPEGGWLFKTSGGLMKHLVSTHSRPKAAGYQPRAIHRS